ncbi:MAG: PAS domain S-box protein, partial [Dehalococcoidales bacterium]|nr:PAS domain S-box protein [Dehalococcoidales bacterium]
AGIYIVQDGKFQFVNPQFIKGTGYTEEELLGMDPQETIHPEDRGKIRESIIMMLKGKLSEPFEFRGIAKNGDTRWGLESVTSIQYHGKRATMGIYLPMTEHKKTSEALKESEERFRVLSEASREGVVIHEDNKILEVNTALARMLHTEPSEMRGKSTCNYTAPEALNYLKTTGKTQHSGPYETTLLRKDGTTFPVEMAGVDSFYKERKVKIVTVRDLTERKETEQKRQTIIQTALDGFILSSREGKILEVNEAYCRMTGYSREELLKASVADIEAAMSPSEIAQGTNTIIEKGAYRFETKHKCKDGRTIDVEISAKYLEEVGQVFVFVRDITEKIRIESALKEGEQRFRRLAENAQDLIYRFILSPAPHFEYVSPASMTITGYTPEAYYDDPKISFKLVHPDDKNILKAIIRSPKTYSGKSVLIRWIHKDGRVVWTNQRLTAIPDEKGKIVALEGIIRDITEDMRMEEALRVSEKNFRNSLDNSPLGIRIVTVDGETIYANQAMLDIYGYNSLKELRDKPVRERYTSESYTEFLQRKEKRERGEPSPTSYEISIVRKDGSMRNLQVFRKEVLWGGEHHFQTIHYDITERKQAEKALRESQARFKELANLLPLSIFETDRKGQFTYVNREGFKAWNITSENADNLKNNIADTLIPADRERFIKNIGNILNGENIGPQEYTALRYDKTSFPVRVYTAPISHDGEIHGIRGISIDITEERQAQETMKISELRYRRLFEAAKDGILILEADTGIIIDVNPFLINLLGLSHQEFIGKNLWELGFLRDIVTSKTKFLELQRKGYVRYENLPLQSADGQQRNVEFVSNVYDVDQHRIIQCNIRDITARKQAEQALRESENKYRELVEMAQEGIWAIDKESLTTFVNKRMTEMLGYTIEEMMGKPLFSFMDKEDVKDAQEKLERHKRGIQEEHEFEFIRKDRQRIYAILGTTPITDKDGNYAGVMAVVSDITTRKLAEEHIRHLNSVLNALRGINQLITLEKDREKLTRNSCDLLITARGYETAWVMLTDKNGNFTSGTSAGLQPRIFSALTRRFKSKQFPACIRDLLEQKAPIIICPQVGKYHEDCPFGKIGKNCSAMVSRLEYEGRLYGVLCVQIKPPLAGEKEEQELFKEITNDIAFAMDRLEKATQLVEAQGKALEAEKLREIDRLRSELLANVSHELRTPLSAIKGFTSTLLRRDVKWTEAQRRDFLQTIDSETDRLTHLINDILDMSRIESGAFKVSQVQSSVSNIIDSIMGGLTNISKEHHLKINLPTKLPPVLIDETRIGQVISNLVDNAVKFSSPGTEITISARHVANEIIISVADHGVGIPRESIGKLFNRFYQAENIVAGRRTGTGLGLAISRGLIENHGGRIWVESKVGIGSKFSFSLPVPKEADNGSNSSSR